MMFSTLTSSWACNQQTLKIFEHSAQPSAAANTNFKMESCDEPLKRYASSGPLLMPRKAAACQRLLIGRRRPLKTQISTIPKPLFLFGIREITDECAPKNVRRDHW